MAKLFPAPGGGGGGGAPLTTTEPAALGTAAAGSSVEAARADHVHAMPTAAQVGARDSSWVPTAAQVGALASTWTPPAQLPTPPMDGAVETMNRVTVGDSSANLLVSGRLYFTFFTALSSITATKFKIQSTGTAAASITLARLGLYTAPNADGSGMTCVAACANTTVAGCPARKRVTASPPSPTRRSGAPVRPSGGGAGMEGGCGGRRRGVAN